MDKIKERLAQIAQEAIAQNPQNEAARQVLDSLWQMPLNVAAEILKAVGGTAVTMGPMGSGSYGERKDALNQILAMDTGIPVNEATMEGLGNLAAGGEVLDIPFRALEEGVENITGSDAAGDAAYWGSQMVGPGLVKGALNLFSKFGKTVSKHVGIDQRPQGDIISKGVTGITRRRGGHYGEHPFDRASQGAESAMRATASAIEGIMSPQAAAIMKKHGVAPVAVRRIQSSRKILDNPNVKAETKKHAEKVLIAELRKVQAMVLKEGKPVSPELAQIVEAYHPRKIEVTGVPKPKQLQSVLEGDIPLPELRLLIDDMSKYVDEGRPNIYAFGGNPQQTAMSGTRHSKILSENPAELFVTKNSTYDMIGDIWSRISEGQRFDTIQNKWFPKPTPGAHGKRVTKYNSLDPMEFNSDTINKIMGSKTKARKKVLKREAEEKYPLASRFKKGFSRIQSENVGAETVKIKGKDHILYHSVRGSDDPLLASTPAALLLNPRTGTTRVLAYDEFDLGSGLTKRVLETGFKKGFWTVNSGTFTYPDSILRRVGVKKRPKEKAIEYTQPDPKMYERIDEMLDVSPAKEWGKRAVIPSTIVGTKKKRDENRKARNIY